VIPPERQRNQHRLGFASRSVPSILDVEVARHITPIGWFGQLEAERAHIGSSLHSSSAAAGALSIDTKLAPYGLLGATASLAGLGVRRQAHFGPQRRRRLECRLPGPWKAKAPEGRRPPLRAGGWSDAGGRYRALNAQRRLLRSEGVDEALIAELAAARRAPGLRPLEHVLGALLLHLARFHCRGFPDTRHEVRTGREILEAE
jgi:hypothetical protein